MPLVLLIHGLNVNERVWDQWRSSLEDLGFKVAVRSYPFHSGEPAMLRRKPDHRLRKVRLKHVVEDYARYIQGLTEKPVLIGHSMGGLVVQKLVEMNLASAGVCICSAPARGIFSLSLSLIISNSFMVNLLKGNALFIPPQKWFHQSIANTVSRERSDAFFESHVVPESRNIPRSVILRDGKVDFKKKHVPLLFIGAEHDRITPAKLNRKNANAYKDKKSHTDFTQFKGRSHFICWEDKWEEVLHCCIDFINKYGETEVAGSGKNSTQAR